MGFAGNAASLERERLERRAITSADGVSSPSRYALDRVRRHYGIELSDAEVIPNPVVLQPPQLQWSLEKSDRKSILFVGRFDRLKGGDLILEAFRIIAQEEPDAELIFVGVDRGLVGEDTVVQHFPEYLRERMPPEHASRVRMLGQQAPSAINELRRSAFVTVVSSRFENFPMTVLEAHSSGIPLVASNVGGIPEIVAHEKNGLLFESGDAPDLARQILRLFRDPMLASRLGRQGAQDAAERYAPEVVAWQTSEFYGRVLARRRR
jgi:glycosyltransferase involved in cell wall biosynthesis